MAVAPKRRPLFQTDYPVHNSDPGSHLTAPPSTRKGQRSVEAHHTRSACRLHRVGERGARPSHDAAFALAGSPACTALTDIARKIASHAPPSLKEAPLRNSEVGVSA